MSYQLWNKQIERNIVDFLKNEALKSAKAGDRSAAIVFLEERHI